MLLGNLRTPLLIVISNQDIMGRAENIPLGGSQRTILDNALKAGRIHLDEVSYCLVDDVDLIRSSEAKIIVTVGERALNRVTGLKSQHKWWGSFVKSTSEFGFRKCIPMLDPEYIEKVYSENAYNILTATKIKAEMHSPHIPEDPRIFHTKLNFKEASQFLIEAASYPELALDIENFSSGIINTLGIAISPLEAIALRIDPGFWSIEEEYELWRLASLIIKNKNIKKYYHNHIYENLYFSRYGIRSEGTAWDTMHGMRFLYPELNKGLDYAGKFFTPYPYWKDDKDDWSVVKDWDVHLNYNGKDTTVTFLVKQNQEKELQERGLLDLFNNYCIKLLEPSIEMSSRGFLVDEQVLAFLTKEAQTKIDIDHATIARITTERLGREINIRSPKQLKAALKELGFVLPHNRNKKTGETAESADKKALNKLKRQHPEEPIIDSLLRISKENKAMSSYLEFTYNKESKIVNYTFDAISTETLRMASYTDNWGRGLNIQTVPAWAKKVFKAPEGRVFIEIDLSQAESRFVAWDSADPMFMGLINRGEDVHSFVASRIYQKAPELITKPQRQLGKKSGHAGNYGVGINTFIESCLVEMGLVLNQIEAKRILNGYFAAFPGVKRRQARIQNELRKNRKLTTCFGFERYFYGRCDDSMFREGYAFEPQSTIPYIINCLMLFLKQCFDDVWLHQQGHDAIVISIPAESHRVEEVMRAASDYEAWHPNIELAGGKLIIPIEAEYGTSWRPMEKLTL